METTNKISEESAKAQLDELLDYYGLDFADIVLEDGEAAAQTLMNTLVRAIRRGELEVNTDDGIKVTQHLRFKVGELATITYLDKVSMARIAMDKVSSKHPQQRMYAFMAALTDGVPMTELGKLKGSDATIFNRIAMVFSMV